MLGGGSEGDVRRVRVLVFWGLTLLVSGCATTGHKRLITPDEDYAQGTDVTVRVAEIDTHRQRTRVRLSVANRLPDPLLVAEIHAQLLDANEQAVPLIRIRGSDVCRGCRRDLDLIFDTRQAAAGVGELRLTGLPVEVGPVLFHMEGLEHHEPTDPFDVVQKIVGYTVGGILLIGLLLLCGWAGSDCSGLWNDRLVTDPREGVTEP